MAEKEPKKKGRQSHKFRLTIIMLASVPLAIGALLITWTERTRHIFRMSLTISSPRQASS